MERGRGKPGVDGSAADGERIEEIGHHELHLLAEASQPPAGFGDHSGVAIQRHQLAAWNALQQLLADSAGAAGGIQHALVAP